MNKKLPYEEELSGRLNDLPLPDENISWEDMKRRLDEDKNDAVILPPGRKGCLGYSLLLLLLAAVALLIMHPGKWPWTKNKKEIVSSGEAYTTRQDDTAVTGNTKGPGETPKQPGPVDTFVKKSDDTADKKQEPVTKGPLKENNRNKKDPQQTIYNRGASINTYAKAANGPGKKITRNYVTGNKKVHKQYKKTGGRLKSNIAGNEQNADPSKNQDEPIQTGNGSMTANNDISIDSITKKDIDSGTTSKKIKDIDSRAKTAKKDSGVMKPFYFAVGIALHQQLPVNGQKLVPYNSLGRKSTLADYIPSLYFRMYKDKKWFLQYEFRYGAPQYTKDILYVQKKVVDTFTRSTLDTSNRLKKTYYHQLPVSFNYFVLPHFSIGIGVIWNKFSSAISEQEVKRTNNLTLVDSFITKTILHPKRADSNFVKSYFQALIETQYQWKRWSFGARYSFGLQPYIRFQLPGAEHREEKNSSLTIFLRYDLWESRKR